MLLVLPVLLHIGGLLNFHQSLGRTGDHLQLLLGPTSCPGRRVLRGLMGKEGNTVVLEKDKKEADAAE
jgi:hypothetical protein